MVLAVQMRMAGTQGLSSNTDFFVSATGSLFCSDLWTVLSLAVPCLQMGTACPVFALGLLGVISASAQEVQPLTEISLFLHRSLHSLVTSFSTRLLWGLKNLCHNLLNGILRRNRNTFFYRGQFIHHISLTMFFLISKTKLFLRGLCSYFMWSFLYFLKECCSKKVESKLTTKSKEVAVEMVMKPHSLSTLLKHL